MMNPLEALLAELVAGEEIHLVVTNDAVTSELRGRGTFRAGEDWLTIEVGGGPDHVHVRRGQLVSAEFVVGEAREIGTKILVLEAIRRVEAQEPFD